MSSSWSQTTESIDDSHRPAKRVKVSQFGLKELAPGTSPVIDIVAIHGIDGDREDSWTADNGVLWLKDLLPQKIPNARILTYGYDANTHDQEQVATDYMHDHAMTFISKLAILREDTSTTKRPIIFVAHSSGGILLKWALIHSHLSHDSHLKHHHAISQSTHGVAFFGTPHLGSATAELAQFLLDILSPARLTTTVLLQHIQRDSESLQHQLAQYSAISGNYDTKFFYEVYDTQITEILSKKVVPKSSAVVPGAVNAEAIGINKDHINMVKFPSAEDEDFRTVSTVLSLMSRNATQNVSERVQTDGTSLKDIMTHLSLSNISRVDEARFDASSHPRCLEGTRVELLKTVTDWVEVNISTEDRRIFWLCGQAGTGKTTISLTVADDCGKKSQLAASFFFSRDHADRNDLRKVFPTIAYQLGIFHSPFKTLLAEVLKQDPAITSIDPTFQFEKLIIGPLKLCGAFPSPAIIVIDALDECADENPISKMVSILSANIQETPHLKFFITSRPENHIACGFRQLKTDALSVILHNIEASIVDSDIERYLRDRFSTTSILYPDRVESDWPSEDSIKSLVGKSGRLFIFAATAMNFILDSNYCDPCNQLDTVLGQSQRNDSSPSSPLAFLDQLYLQVLRQAFPSTATPSSRLTLVRKILGAIVLLRDPLSPGSLEGLLNLRRGDVRTTLRQLHSIIVVPDADDHPIRLLHPSFFDFAISRCADPDFLIGQSICHEQLAIACFEQMKNLKRDICNIQDPSQLNSEIEDLADRVKQYISPSMQYACRYWSYHMCNASTSTILGLLQTFCHTRMLYWIEALSLIDSLRDGIRQINAIIKFLHGLSSPAKELVMTLKDTARFIADYFDAISVATLQLYRTALPLAPKSIYLPFNHEARGGMQVLHGGDLLLSEVTTFPSPANYGQSVEFSPDGELILSTSYYAILLWDRDTGTFLKTLEDSESGKYGFARLVTVFPDGKRVISGYDNYTLRTWNIATGVCLETIQLEGSDLNTEEESIYYAFSPDFTRVVGTTDGGSLHLWNTSNGAVLNTLRRHSEPICTVAFSPNGLLIASGAWDSLICLWDAVDCILLRVLRAHSHFVVSIAFSPNNRTLVSSSHCIRLWDVTNGAASNSFNKGRTDIIESVTFSPDGTGIISGSDDGTLRVWSVAEGKLLKTINCPDKIQDVGISPDGMQYFMSAQNAIYLWDSDHVPNRDRSKWDFCDVKFLPDGTHIISTNDKDTDIYLWNGLTGVFLEELEGHSDNVTCLACGSNGNFFASGSKDRTIRLWDIPSRKTLRVMTRHSRPVYSLAFSPDSTLIVSTTTSHRTVRIWDVASGNNVFTIHVPNYYVGPANFSPDGSQIVTDDGTYTIPPKFRSYLAHSNGKGAEVSVYSKEGEWIFVDKGGDMKRCVWIPGAWRGCRTSFSHGRVAIGTRHGLVLLDLSGIHLSSNHNSAPALE